MLAPWADPHRPQVPRGTEPEKPRTPRIGAFFFEVSASVGAFFYGLFVSPDVGVSMFGCALFTSAPFSRLNMLAPNIKRSTRKAASTAPAA